MSSRRNDSHNVRKRCVKKGFEGIHDRFQKDLRYRDVQLKADRIGEKCIEMDELALKDFTHRPSTAEFESHKKTWSFSLNTSGRNAPMKLFSAAVTKMHRLYRESGKERPASLLSTSIRNGIRRLLHPVHHGGSGVTIGGAHQYRSRIPLSS